MTYSPLIPAFLTPNPKLPQNHRLEDAAESKDLFEDTVGMVF